MEQMQQRLERQERLLGVGSTPILAKSRVALFGLGGVGSYAAEALARGGVGCMVLIDKDEVSESNLNRQLCALTDTVGRPKVSVVAERLKKINPGIEIEERQEFFLPETAHRFDFSAYDYVIDAIDTVAGKIAIAEAAARVGVPMISCMGTGNKQDPTAFRVSDLARTSVCPLARVMRRELKKRGILHLTVVYSEEIPMEAVGEIDPDSGKHLPGSLSFVPPVAGMIAAGEAIKTLLKRKERGETHE